MHTASEIGLGTSSRVTPDACMRSIGLPGMSIEHTPIWFGVATQSMATTIIAAAVILVKCSLAGEVQQITPSRRWGDAGVRDQ